MFGRKRLISVGLFVGIIGLVLLFPARVAYLWFAPPQVALSGISGTIWSGYAREATVDGFYLRDLSWRFQPLNLFTARLGYTIESKFASGFAEGDIAIGFGSVRARNLLATLPLNAIQATSMAGARGSLSADIVELKIVDGLPVVADGSLEVAGLVLPLVHREPIGGFKAEMFTGDSGISASIEDTAAVIDLAGSLQLSADGVYEFYAQISAIENTPPQLREQLRFLGSANDRGQHELRLEGRL
ncbi:MAG: type II secretion system protein N [Woeseiaceae bacterium]